MTAISDDLFESQLTTTLTNLNSLQATFKKQRGKKPLALMVATLMVSVENIIANVDESVRQLILSQYQIKLPREGSSRFSPWISITWGEDDAKADKVEAIDGKHYTRWVPDASMAVYFHAMEAAADEGFDADSDPAKIAEWFLAEGGTQKVANARKKQKADERAGRQSPSEERARELYLSDGPATPLSLDASTLNLPDDVAVFFTLVVERAENGTLVARGVADKDASKSLNKMAAGSFDALNAARTAAADRQRWIEEGRAAERADREGGDALKGSPDNPIRISPEQVAEMVARTKAKLAATQD